MSRKGCIYAKGALAAMLLSVAATAQVKFTATADRAKVGVGQHVTVTWSLNTVGSSFSPPSIQGFDVLSGPNKSTSMHIINGSVTQSVSYQFVLRARAEGKFTVGPATVTANGNEYTSNALTIEVVKGDPSPSQPEGAPTPGSAGDDQLFARLSADKLSVYAGEALTLTHRIYSRLNLAGFDNVKYPTFNGFLSYDIVLPGQITLHNETVNGMTYRAAELKKNVLFPQRSGRLAIEPMDLECIVREQRTRQPGGFFDPFWGMGYRDVKYAVRSKPLTVTVKPLPDAGRPPGFRGAVGRYTLKAVTDRSEVKANEAVNLNVTISGSGNLKLLAAPEIAFPADFEVYDPKISENISVGNAGVSGSKTFEYVIIPRHQGDFTIAPFVFSYFHPETGTYVSLSSPEFPIRVTKGAEGDQAGIMGGNGKEAIKYVGSDIRFIKTGPFGLREKGNRFYGSAGFFALLPSPFLLLGLFLIARRKQRAAQGDVAGLRSRKATKLARKKLAVARKLLGENRRDDYYEEVLKALWGYVGDKLRMATADLSGDSVREALLTRGAATEDADRLTAMIGRCEFARYAPRGTAQEMENLYSEAVDVIRNIESRIR